MEIDTQDPAVHRAKPPEPHERLALTISEAVRAHFRQPGGALRIDLKDVFRALQLVTARMLSEVPERADRGRIMRQFDAAVRRGAAELLNARAAQRVQS